MSKLIFKKYTYIRAKHDFLIFKKSQLYCVFLQTEVFNQPAFILSQNGVTLLGWELSEQELAENFLKV